MKQVSIFIGCWILFWLLITAVGWFANPGMSFRVVSGTIPVVLISLFIGWVPGLLIVADMEDTL